MIRSALALLVCAVLGSLAEAHPMDIGYLSVDVRGAGVDVALDLDTAAVAHLLAIPPTGVDATLATGQAGQLARLTYAAEPMQQGGATCTWQPAHATLTGRTVRIASTATCPGTGPRVLRVEFMRNGKISERFQLLVQPSHTGADELALVDRATAQVLIGGGAPEAGVVHFVGAGIAHIGVAPSEWRTAQGHWRLPDGIAHVLFLLGLLLGGGTLLKLIGVTTGYTVGYTITLALAALGVVHPPGWLIEPLLALSIVFIAGEALTQKLAKHRWKIALGCGLVHGFRFANALTELHLGTGAMVKVLFGYDLGLAIGQLAIVLVLAPLVVVAHTRRWAHVWVIRTAAVALALCGLYWFVQRVSA